MSDNRTKWNLASPGGWGSRLAEAGFYLGTLVLAAGPILDMLADAWNAWGITRHLTRLFLYSFNIADTTTFYLLFGFVLGILLTFLLDSFKRNQGVILLGGLGISSVFVLYPRNVLVRPMLEGFTPTAGLLGLIAVAGGLYLSGVRQEDFQKGATRRYPAAGRLLNQIALFALVVGFFEAHFIYQSPVVAFSGGGIRVQPFQFQRFVGGIELLTHLLAVPAGLWGLRGFTNYERELNVIQIGPQRSGKSAAFGGFTLAIRDRIDGSVVLDSEGVDLQYRSIQDGVFPPPTRAENANLLKLPFKSVDLFPKSVTLQSVDYPGDILGKILKGGLGIDDRDSVRVDGGQPVDNDLQFPADEHSDGEGTPGNRQSDEEEVEEVVRTAKNDVSVSKHIRFSEASSGSNSDRRAWIELSVQSDREERVTVRVRDEIPVDIPMRKVSLLSDKRADVNWETEEHAVSLEPELEPHAGVSVRYLVRYSQDSYDSEFFGSPTIERITPSTPDARQQESTSFSISPSWERATARVEAASSDQELIPAVWDCIANAERVILTVPLDDFIGPILDRGNAPAYQKSVKKSEGMSEQEMFPLSYRGYEFRPSDVKRIEYGGDVHYVLDAEFDRPDPERYVDWYWQLIKRYKDQKQFIIAVTMSDWAVPDFKAQTDGASNPAIDYDEFAEHVYDLLTSVNGRFEDIVNEDDPRTPDQIYPVWYDITNDEPPLNPKEKMRIDTDSNQTTLRGARQLIERTSR